jgi:hypothetical protein
MAAGVVMAPAATLAQRADGQRDILDGRLEGYPSPVTLEDSGTSMTWLLLVFLTIVCLSVMFKDARRTHLD